jgi:restriction endonuclease Mrr
VHLGGPCDGGVDLVLINGPRRYVVQVKRRQSATIAECISSVREFVGAMVIAGETRGIFVSTAPTFSRQAVRDSLVAQTRGAIEYLELVNGRRLLEVCEIASERDSADWQRALTEEDTVLEHINTGRFEFLDLVFPPHKPR